MAKRNREPRDRRLLAEALAIIRPLADPDENWGGVHLIDECEMEAPRCVTHGRWIDEELCDDWEEDECDIRELMHCSPGCPRNELMPLVQKIEARLGTG